MLIGYIKLKLGDYVLARSTNSDGDENKDVIKLHIGHASYA